MASDRFARIESLYHAALSRPPADRAAFLAEACADDEALRREVESLLAEPSADSHVLAAPAFAGTDGGAGSPAQVARDAAASRGSLVGRRLGPYDITSSLGAGGMGEVYKARDTKLRRDVAIKILPASFALDHGRRQRFEREAVLIAAVNHPHIAAIYGVEEYDGIPALVLELVTGDTLADRIARGPLSVPEALRIARQLAEALDAAHEKGIVHRDLKPANIALTPEGVVKVLDFGLAMQRATEAATTDTDVPTMESGRTREGMILGTPAYMSPEQARALKVDKRTDIWAFGCVVYEMLTGRPAFAGATVTDTLASVLQQEPNWSALPTNTPPAVMRVLRRCLQKDLKLRTRDIADALVEIDEAHAIDAPPTTPAAIAARGWSWRWLVAAPLATLAIGAAGGLYVRPGPRATTRSTVRMSVSLGSGEQFERSRLTNLAWSPDGRSLVYSAMKNGASRLFLRSIDRVEAQLLPGTEGGIGPIFSPNGSWIAFWADGRLKKVSTAGGPPVTVMDATPNSDTVPSLSTGYSTDWRSSDAIVFALPGGRGIWEVSASGGTPHLLVGVDRSKGESEVGLPHVLPSGKDLLLTVRTGSVRNWGKAQVVMQSLESGKRDVLVDGAADGRYIPGYLLYLKNAVLTGVTFDASTRKVTGTPFPVADGVMQALNLGSPSSETGAGQFGVSISGSLAYVLGGGRPFPRHALAWVTRDGATETLSGPRRWIQAPRISPDGRRLAVSADDDIWVHDIARETWTRVTQLSATAYAPVWSPDGTRLVFSSDASGSTNLFSTAADGSGTPEQLTTLTEDDARQDPQAYTPDGRDILFTERHVPRRDLVLVPVTPGARREPRVLLKQNSQFLSPTFSPDGHWLAYGSDASGTAEVFVRPYPSLGEQIPISSGGGTDPLWAHNGHELFYRQGNRIMAVDYTTSPRFTPGKPRVLFSGHYDTGTAVRHFDISLDDRRFLMTLLPDDAPEKPVSDLTIVVNWVDELGAKSR